MNKKIVSALAASLFYMSIATAADDMQMRNLENRVNALEQRRGSNGMINPAARPVVKDGTDLWIQADALYMRPTQDGLGYAIQSHSGTASSANGRVKNARYDWDWGFRVGAGYNLDHDGWDVLLNYTWFESDAHQNVSGGSIAPEFALATSLAGSTTSNAKANTRFWLNILDLEMGREFFVSKWLTLRPHAGLRALWIHTKLHSRFSDLIAGSAVKINAKNRFGGGGLRAGLNSQWGLGSGWSIFGDLDAALMYGKQRVRQSEEEVSTDADLASYSDNWMTLRASLDLALGLRWDRLFYDDAYRIRFQLGWEDHVFFDMSQFANQSNNGNISLNGLAFQARFDF